MAITPERLIQIAKAKGVDTSKYEAKLGGQTEQPNELSRTLETLKAQGLLAPEKGMRGNVADAMFRVAGKEPPASYGGGIGEDGVGKLVLGKVLGDALKDPIDVQIDRDYKRASTERALRDPFYMSNHGQQYYGAKTDQAAAQAENFKLGSGIVRDAIGGQGQGNLPVGTTVTSGGITVPVNPKLDESQTNVISGVNKYAPMVDRLEALINKGALEGTGHKLMAEYGNKSMIGRYLTPDNTPIEELASIASELQKYMFSEGGKTLSPTEKTIVNSGLTFAGKSNEQIKHDVSEAINILRLKKDIIFGGMNAAMQQTPSVNPVGGQVDFSKMSDEELMRIAGGQ